MRRDRFSNGRADQEGGGRLLLLLQEESARPAKERPSICSSPLENQVAWNVSLGSVQKQAILQVRTSTLASRPEWWLLLPGLSVPSCAPRTPGNDLFQAQPLVWNEAARTDVNSF